MHSLETNFQFRGKSQGIKPFGGADKKAPWCGAFLILFVHLLPQDYSISKQVMRTLKQNPGYLIPRT